MPGKRLKPGDFEEAVLRGLGSLSGAPVLLAAVSGGADSTAMLAALSRLRERGGFSLRAAHVEHGIRPAEESRGDARAVRSLCAGLGLACRVLSIRPGRVAEAGRQRGTGLEAAARHFRYRALRREALRCGAAAIVTAHTADDNLELCLMRILRGSGPGGLGPMPPSRSFTAGGASLRILRPLLGLSRGDVESYLAGRGLSWREDASNSDMGFLRNRVRAKLVPLLEGEFPGWKRGLGALGETQSLAADFIAKEARNRLPWEWVETRRGRELRTGGFFDEPRIIREEALFQGLNLFHPPSAPGRRNLRRFARGEIRDLDLGFCRIAAGPEGAAIFRPPEAGGFSLLIKGPGLYKLEGIGAGLHYGAARAGKPVLKVWEGGESPGGQGFFAALPLLLRCPGEFGRLSFKDLKGPAASGTRTVPPFCFQNIALAQDAAGPAALIGLSPAVVLWKREGSSGDSFFCGIGGIDA